MLPPPPPPPTSREGGWLKRGTVYYLLIFPLFISFICLLSWLSYLVYHMLLRLAGINKCSFIFVEETFPCFVVYVRVDAKTERHVFLWERYFWKSAMLVLLKECSWSIKLKALLSMCISGLLTANIIRAVIAYNKPVFFKYSFLW